MSNDLRIPVRFKIVGYNETVKVAHMYIVDLHNFNCSLFSWTVVIRRDSSRGARIVTVLPEHLWKERLHMTETAWLIYGSGVTLMEKNMRPAFKVANALWKASERSTSHRGCCEHLGHGGGHSVCLVLLAEYHHATWPPQPSMAETTRRYVLLIRGSTNDR